PIAKLFAFCKIRGKRRAVNRDQMPDQAAIAVNRLYGYFFAGSTFALNQHVEFGWSNKAEGLDHLLQGFATACEIMYEILLWHHVRVVLELSLNSSGNTLGVLNRLQRCAQTALWR